MKKTYIYAAALSLFYGMAMGQLRHFEGVNFGDTPNPVPSLTSFATFTDNPPALAKGIPEISVPLLSIPGYAGSGMGLQLSYDPTDSAGSAVGESGAGWLMSKGGVISRKINGFVDELFQYEGEERLNFDDEYYYNFPGFSGKFKIARNAQQNTFSIIDLDPLNHVKIAYTKQSNPNPKTLIVDSFTITDDQGNTYHFNDYSIAAVYDRVYDDKGLWGAQYKSAFYLTRITNADGVETASFTYKKETKNYLDDMLLYQTCQLEKINTASGNVEIVYDYDQTLEKTKNDPYSIKKLIMSNAYAKTAEYAFEYSYPFPTGSVENTTKRRQLDKIKKMDGQTVVEETSFVYHPLTYSSVSTGSACDGSQVQNPLGILSKIIYPTKGVTEFIYEGGEVYKDRSSAEFLESLNTDFRDNCIQSIKNFPPLKFDTRQSVTYTFTVSGDPAKKQTFWLKFVGDSHFQELGPINPNTGIPFPRPILKPEQKVNYTLQRGSEVLVANTRADKLQFYNYPGQYTITINIPYVGGAGNFILSELVIKPGTYRNATGSSPYRIKSIKKYADVGSSTPVQSIAYAYESFSLPNSSSGYSTYGAGTIYKNVRVTQDSGKGYTQYEFKLSDSYPSYPYVKDGVDGTFMPYYNLVKSGILEKKEIYSESGKLLSRDNFEYTFALANDVDYPVSIYSTYSKAAYFSQTKSSSVVYPSGSASSFLSSSSETNVRADNFKPSSSKSVSADGTTTESFYQYAQDKNHTRLLAANMTGIPLESEVKENGKTIGKSETRFDHATNLYPTSEISYNRQTQSPVTTSTFDVYDSKGNLVQATGKNGIPSTTIWGYYQTMPIAVISGASYSQVASLASVTAAIAASNADYDNPANEPALLQALENLRKDPALKDYGVTASTYDPLIGVTNSISGNGIRTVNIYDTVGRLIKVTDVEGKTLQENQYNYKH